MSSAKKGKPEDDNNSNNSNVHTERDAAGNMLQATSYPDTIEMYLHLVSEKHPRHIGTIDKARRYFFANRTRGIHLHYKSGSYGFNYEFLSKAKMFDFVCLSDELQAWKIPVSFILEKKNFLHFKKEGFEKQIFVTLEEIAQFERQKKAPAY